MPQGTLVLEVTGLSHGSGQLAKYLYSTQNPQPHVNARYGLISTAMIVRHGLNKGFIDNGVEARITYIDKVFIEK